MTVYRTLDCILSKSRKCRKQASTLDSQVIARNDAEISERAPVCRNVDGFRQHTRTEKASTFRQNLISQQKPP